jgi:putative DNA methylase
MPDVARVEERFPFAGVSDECAAEKSVRHAHISTLQQWFARRPLAVCRAALFLALCPGPDELEGHPGLIQLLERHVGPAGSVADRIDRFTVALSAWKSTKDEEILEDARHILGTNGSNHPLIIDTFAGGGSIPLEALRLGLATSASDLHPTACLALRAALEFLPENKALIDEYERLSEEVRTDITRLVAPLYGPVGATPLAFFWARTYTCPECQRETVLMRDRYLARGPHAVGIEIGYDARTESLTSRVVQACDSADLSGTVDARGARCIHCDTVVKTAWLQAEGTRGRIGEWLYAKLHRDGTGSRVYTHADASDRALAASATPAWSSSTAVPDSHFDANGVRHTWAMQYGVRTIADLHSNRQATALDRVLGIIRSKQVALETAGRAPSDVRGLVLLLTLTFNRLLPYGTRHTWWQSNGEFPANMYSRQAIPMVWHYVEMPVCSPAAAGWSSAVAWSLAIYRHIERVPSRGTVTRTDAAHTHHADAVADVVAIDPPYFDSVAYSYLAEPFRAWTRGLLAPLFPADFEIDDVAEHEAIVDRAHTKAPSAKDAQHFERKMTEALIEASRILRDDGVLILMYGHKESRAWEALLEAVTRAGFIFTASWPVRTERKAKFRHGTVNALATSCLLVCRKYSGQARPSLSWEAFLPMLEQVLVENQMRMVTGGIDGPDLEAALLAPAMKLFAEHAVHRSDGTAVSVSQFFAEVPAALSRVQGVVASSSPDLSEIRLHLANIASQEGGLRDFFAHPDHADHPVIVLARDLRDGLSRGKPADRAWSIASESDRRSALALLRFIALSAKRVDPERQLIESALGRYAMPHFAGA